jgi:hypothetical protein
MAHYKCNAAMVVTTHWFTEGARQLAQSNGCLLVDRDELARWIVAFQEGSPGGAITHPRHGLAFLGNVPAGLIAAGAGLVLCAMVSLLGHQGETRPPQSSPEQQQEAQEPDSTVAQYRAAVLSLNPSLTTDWADRLANDVVSSSRNNAVDARLVMAVLDAETKFDIGGDPDSKIARTADRLHRVMTWASAQRGTELQRLQVAISRYRAGAGYVGGKHAHKMAANRRRKEFTQKVVRLYYQMCGKTPP